MWIVRYIFIRIIKLKIRRAIHGYIVVHYSSVRIVHSRQEADMFLIIYIAGAFIYFVILSCFFVFFVNITCFYGFVAAIFVSFYSVRIQMSGVVLSIYSGPVAVLLTVVVIQHTDGSIRIVQVHRRIGIGSDRNHHPA